MCEKGAVSTRAGRGGVLRRGLRARLFAWQLAHAADAQEALYAERKRALFAGLATPPGCGPPRTVVEIGAGAGPNARYLARGTRWVVVEPNAWFHPHLRRAAERHGLDLDLRPGTAEALPVEGGAADAVVSTLVLCSVGDVEAALSEARRVLRPGGRFYFVEHVAAPPGSGLRAWQRALRRPWGWAADGCRPDRETGRRIREAGFADVQMEAFTAPLGLAAPHVAGVATVGGIER
ncbi:class I SAM-dependent methyltransferase [Rubrivirga sp. S365]|uniref:Class I SAM-dependent methyltransferase n=1 Tax=Rubrivirga litoralis TaxID=3075598 RepID=A0ABU3BLI3_9BACT|nr:MULTISPECIES: class I SAM-dependent methyltransferase [unclassified Rubrivirga]MDT0630146.1 class I SAM-dependent methyltransferase [Rubrivirga sp. F394]MDT7855657.1 class I SAM-dependent methyltransferase [Rubrivirga sp. S365]